MPFLYTALFAAIAGVEFFYLNNQVLTGPGLAAHRTMLSSKACFSQPGFTSYSWLPPAVDQFNCVANTFFMIGHADEDTRLLLGVFGGVFLSTIFIVVYEAFRPVHRASSLLLSPIARIPSLFLLAGQHLTAGFTTPLHLAFASWSTDSGMGNTMMRRNTAETRNRVFVPTGGQAWSVLLAVLLGFALPSLYMEQTGFSYLALTIWQPFPLYVFALNLILPLVLPKNLPRNAAIILMALLATGQSVKTHVEFLNATVWSEGAGRSLQDVFLLRHQLSEYLPTIQYVVHHLFMTDFSFVLLTTFLWVSLGYRRGAAGVAAVFVPFSLLSVLLGPGTALILIWAYREIGLGNNVEAPHGKTE